MRPTPAEREYCYALPITHYLSSARNMRGDHFTSTIPTLLTVLLAITGLPSGVTLMLRTM